MVMRLREGGGGGTVPGAIEVQQISQDTDAWSTAVQVAAGSKSPILSGPFPFFSGGGDIGDRRGQVWETARETLRGEGAL